MANYTENFNLIKPEDDEYYDVADFNENMDVIDAALAGNSGASEMLQGIISADGQGVRVVKSIQWITASYGDGSSVVVCPLSPKINPSRSIALMQKMFNGTLACNSIAFTLNEEELRVTFGFKASSGTIHVGFWVIEFY